MKSLLIVKPLPVLNPDDSGAGGMATLPFLATPNPKEAYVALGVGNRQLTWDTGATQAIDTVYLGWVNAPDGATINVLIDGNSLGVSAPAAGQAGLPRHLFVKGEPIVGRYISVTTTGMPGLVVTVGVAAAGAAWSAQWGQEWGAGRFVGDTSGVERLFGGGFGIDEGARFTGYQWTFGDLQTAERESLYALQYNLGTSRSVLVIEDWEASAGLNERIHWGLFAKLEPFERLDPQNTRWSLRVEDWA